MKCLLFPVFFALAAAAAAQLPDDVSLEAVPGISGLDAPLGLKHAGDGSGRIFIVEQGGTVRIIDTTGSLLAEPFVELGTRVTTENFEQGLFDIAFHPQYDTNGRFFLHYSTSADQNLNPPPPSGALTGDTVIAEFSVSPNPDIANQAPEQYVMTVRQDFANHNGGQMKFGPDGYLYIGLGDGGGGNDKCDRAQTLDPEHLLEPDEGICPSDAAALDPSRALLGKMLRIDIDNTTPPVTPPDANNLCAANDDGSANYAVPVENPFSGMANRCGEVLLYGLRNPWRWSFDRQTQDLWIGDVGQSHWEEIDLLQTPVAAAENLGWKPCEGSFERGSTIPCQLAGSILPVLEYPRQTPNCSVTGGYRYRGPATSLRGLYIYGDFCSGNIWFADNDSGSWQSTLTGFNQGNIRSFGEDEEGNVYVIAGGGLFRFEGDTELIFADGFEQ